MSKSSKATSGVALWGIVFVILLVLKLTGVGMVATWSWWWVLAPIWGPWVLLLVGYVLCYVADYYDK